MTLSTRAPEAQGSVASTRWARALPALVVAVAFVHGAAMTWRTWGNPYVDAGREWELPRRLAEGALLYRDVRFYYGPFAPYLNAALYQLAGVHLDVLVGAGLVSAAAMCAALFAISRQFVGPWVSSAVAASFVYVCAFAQLQSLSIFNFVLPYSFSATYGAVAAAWSLALLLRHLRSGRSLELAGSVACLAMAVLSKLETATPAALAHGVFLVASLRRLDAARVASYLVAGAAVAATFGVFALAAGDALWRENLGGVVNAGSLHYVRLVMGLDVAPDAARFIGWSGLSLAVAIGFTWIAGVVAAHDRVPPPLKWAAVLGAGAGVLVGYARVDYRIPLRALPLLAVLAVAAHLAAWWRRPGERAAHLAALVLWTFVGGCLVRIPFQSTPYHYGFFLLPVGLAGVGALLGRDLPLLLGDGPWCRRAFTATACGLLAGTAAGVAVHTRSWAAWSTAEVVTPRGRLRLPAAWPDREILSWLERRDPRTTLLTVPQGAGYLFLGGLSPGDSMFSYLPMEVSGDEADARLLARWRAHPPDLVLWTRHDMRADFGVRGFGIDYARASAEWIRRNYRRVEGPAGATELLERVGSN
jgi:hypothetical protein